LLKEKTYVKLSSLARIFFNYPQPSKLGEKIVNMLQLRVIYSQNKCENLAKFGIFASFLAVWFGARI
jgi:hypothetical protein